MGSMAPPGATDGGDMRRAPPRGKGAAAPAKGAVALPGQSRP